MARHHQNPFAWLALGSIIALVGACSVFAEVDREKIPEKSSDSNGAGGEAGSAGTGGTGGTTGGTGGGSTACTGPEDCPGTDSDCRTRTCENGDCGFDNAAAGTEISDQTDGDCKVIVCDGNGNVTSENDDDDLPPTTSDCVVASCSGGVASTENVAEGETCATMDGNVCDGKGNCVECVDNAQCTGANEICDNNSCVVDSCANGQKDNNETDEDCGGSDCDPCANGLDCIENSDCQSLVCDDTAKTCSAPTCDDTVQNGDETGVDCGGTSCLLCDGDACTDDTECKSGDCDTGNTDTCI